MRELDGLIPRFLLGSALVVTMSAVKFCSIAADPSPLAGMSFQAFGPPPVISNQAAKVAHQIKLEPRATLFVHGWDFRYYSYFNKYVIGPWIIEGAKHPSTYAAEVLQENPTVILDVVNHSGLVRDGRFTLAAHPLWSQAILPRYTRVFDENGLVVYVLSTEVQAAGKPPEVKN